MFSSTEMRGQSSLDKHGSIELHTEFFRIRRPIWLVFLKVLGVVAMVAVGFAIALPTMKQEVPDIKTWQACAWIAAAMVVYTAIAFFIRPEANGDNMANDASQYSDNINRWLWKAHMILGPGRFTSETLLDVGVLFGLVKGVDPDFDESMPEYTGVTPEAIIASSAPSPPGAGPASSLYSAPPPTGNGMQLESWKYFQQQS